MGVCFQTEQKSPRNYLRSGDKRGEPFSRQSHHTRCLFSRGSGETLLICVASPDRSPKMISLNLCLSVPSITHIATDWGAKWLGFFKKKKKCLVTPDRTFPKYVSFVSGFFYFLISFLCPYDEEPIESVCRREAKLGS